MNQKLLAEFTLWRQEHESIYTSFITRNKNTVDSWFLSYGVMDQGLVVRQDLPKDISVKMDDSI